MAITTPLINGVNYSFGNITLVLFGVPILGFTKIEYKVSQKKEDNYGAGFEPVSRGYSNKTYSGMIEIFMDEWRRVMIAAKAKGYNSPLDIPAFDIQVIYGGSRITAATDVLRMCEFTEDAVSVSQGDSKIMISLPLIIAKIDHIL